MIRKIVIFPNDSLKAYFDKGELAEGYFNPGNFFQEIHIISLNDEEISENKVKMLAGKASLKIHKIGRPGIFNIVSGKCQKRVKQIVKEIRPLVLRAYNSNLAGWLAVRSGQELHIPIVISIHTNPELDIRACINKFLEPRRWALWNISKNIFEPYVLSKASKIICVYEFLYSYALKFGADAEKVEIIYNRIDMDRFTGKDKAHRPAADQSPLNILCIGRMCREKNPENIIRAIKELNVKLTLIGDGEYFDRLKKLVEDLNMQERVDFTRSVEYGKIHSFYKEADIFASSNNAGGVSKPVIEAMASGIPVVVNKPLWEEQPELVGDLALVVENSPAGYMQAFKKLIINKGLREEMGSKMRLKALEISGEKMEKKEVDLYRLLIEPINEKERV